MPIRLVLADDHLIVLEGLEQLFRNEPDFEVVATCSGGSAAVEAVARHRPDVLVLDLRMPGVDGLEVIRRLQASGEIPTRVVLLTGSIDEEEALEAIRLGVRGVVLKEMASRLLVECVRKVHAGERWLERGSFGAAMERAARREAAASDLAARLTPREIEIVRLVGRGLRNREIAERLFISEGTVKGHLHRVFTKLDLDTRSALTRYALEKGLN